MNKTILSLSFFILSMLYACNTKKISLIDEITIDENKIISKSTRDTTDYSAIYIPSDELYIGQKLTVNYQAYGCFNFLEDNISITKNKDGYTVVHGKENIESNKTNTTKFDSTYTLILKSFSLSCKKIMIENEKNKLKDNEIYSIGTVHKITMNDGFHQLELFIDNEKLFYSLLRPLPLF
jgi:hypothetical protein